VGWKCGIGVTGEGAYLTGVLFGTFFGEELEGPVAGCFEFTVRPVGVFDERIVVSTRKRSINLHFFSAWL